MMSYGVDRPSLRCYKSGLGGRGADRNGGGVGRGVGVVVTGEMRERRLAETFVELADILVDEFDVIDFLTLPTARCVELLDVSAAGVLLAGEKRAASTGRVLR